MLSDEDYAKKLQAEEYKEIIIQDKTKSKEVKNPLSLETNENNASPQLNQQNFVPADYGTAQRNPQNLAPAASDPTQLNQNLAPASNRANSYDPDASEQNSILLHLKQLFFNYF
ncbi:unnamed protein product [Blepharisma stoltei]|uniref:Uncharacterized protein n=1 Tax=Blepharisma stoltei TaxID=1481888 RepID=A0AAU9IKZ4_9CILI|nr:unnamed protein product [Blepharisma stoltei]